MFDSKVYWLLLALLSFLGALVALVAHVVDPKEPLSDAWHFTEIGFLLCLMYRTGK